MLTRKGFTLIEVSLFLALSGALVASLIIGTSRSISQKRYNDTVDNFVDYLQGLYSDVNYVQGTGTTGGKSNQAIYGKLIITNNWKEFKKYTVLGNATCKSTKTDALEALNECKPELMRDGGTEISESYKLSWGGMAKDSDGKRMAILIITHPKTGMKYTYLKTDNNDFTTANIFNSGTPPTLNISNKTDINFCLSSDDESAAGYTGGKHKLIRIHANSHNASGVEIIGDDKRGGLCE